MPRLTVTAAGETATVDVEPVGPGLTSVTKLGTGTLNKRMDQLAAGNGITLPPGVISDPDCNYPTNYPVYCYYLAKPTSVTGSSTSASVLEVRAGSLTQTYQKIDSYRHTRHKPVPCDARRQGCGVRPDNPWHRPRHLREDWESRTVTTASSSTARSTRRSAAAGCPTYPDPQGCRQTKRSPSRLTAARDCSRSRTCWWTARRLRVRRRSPSTALGARWVCCCAG
jgi:hypothetical protein